MFQSKEMIKYKKYLLITLILTSVFATANIMYNVHLNSFKNFDFAYNYREGIPEDVSTLNKIMPSLTKNISLKQLQLLLSEKDISLNSVINIDSLITLNTGQIRFQFSRDSILQSIKIVGYNFSSYDSIKTIGSPNISFLFSNNREITPLIRIPQFLSLIFIFIFLLLGLISIALFYLKHSLNLNFLVVSISSFLLVIISSFFTLFFYFNYSFQVSPDEIMFVHNYINPQLLYEWILSVSKFRSILFDINVFSFLVLLYLLYAFYKQLNKKIFKEET